MAAQPAAREPLIQPSHRIMAVAFLVDLGVSALSLGVQFRAIEMGARPALLGLIGTVGSVVYSLCCLFSGRIADRYGQKLPVLVGCALGASVWLVMLQVTRPEAFLLLMPISGFAMSLVWPAMQSWLGHLCGSNRQRLNHALSQFNVAWTAGIMFGPLLSGLLWKAHPSWTFILPAILVYGCLPIILRTLMAGHGSASAPATETRVPVKTVQFFLLLAWVGNFASWFARSTVTGLFPKLGDELRFTPSLVGALIFILGVAQLGTFALARLSEGWHYHLRFLLLAEALGAGGMVLAALTNSPALLAAGFVAAGICGGVTYVSSLTYSLHGVAEERGKRSGLHEAVLGTGMWLGPLLGGLLGDAYNMHAPFTAAAVVFGLAVILQCLLWSGRRQLLAQEVTA